MSGKFDVLVIGGGPVGIAAALRAQELRARELGGSVGLVERGSPGGDPRSDGSALARAAHMARLLREAEADIARGQHLPTNFQAVLEHALESSEAERARQQHVERLAQAGVTVLQEVGAARFLDRHAVVLPDGRVLQAQRFILCTGSVMQALSIPGGEYTLRYSDLWNLRKPPASAIVIGAGAQGCALASLLAAFGTQVTLMDTAARILPDEDAQTAQTLHADLEAAGVKIISAVEQMHQVERFSGRCALTYSRMQQVHMRAAEVIMAAGGMRGNVTDLGLFNAGVRVERGFVQVNARLQTSSAHIYAAGSLIGPRQSIRDGLAQARTAAQHAVSDLPAPPAQSAAS